MVFFRHEPLTASIVVGSLVVADGTIEFRYQREPTIVHRHLWDDVVGFTWVDP